MNSKRVVPVFIVGAACAALRIYGASDWLQFGTTTDLILLGIRFVLWVVALLILRRKSKRKISE